MRPHALEHDRPSCRSDGFELVVDLVPAERRRDRRVWLRSDRVHGGDRLALAVLVRVDQDPAAARLRPLGRRELRVRARDRARDDLREPTRVVVGRAPVERDEHVKALAARRLRERLERERVEQLLEDQRDLDRLRPRHLGRRVEIEEDEVRPVGLVDARVPRVHVDAAHVHHPEQRRARRRPAEIDPPLRRAVAAETCAREASGSTPACAAARPSGRTPCRRRRRG